MSHPRVNRSSKFLRMGNVFYMELEFSCAPLFIFIAVQSIKGLDSVLFPSSESIQRRRRTELFRVFKVIRMHSMAIKQTYMLRIPSSHCCMIMITWALYKMFVRAHVHALPYLLIIIAVTCHAFLSLPEDKFSFILPSSILIKESFVLIYSSYCREILYEVFERKYNHMK